MADAYLTYSRSKFATRLPRGRVYTAGHVWMQVLDGGVTRVGFTKFATRMLGEIVEFEFESKPGSAVAVGQPIGWFEGFKAISELYCPLGGVFAAYNRDLNSHPEAVHKAPYENGWLYEVAGSPPPDALSPEGYAEFLDATIDRMMGTGS